MEKFVFFPDEVKGILPSASQMFGPTMWFEGYTNKLPDIKKVFEVVKYFYTVDGNIFTAINKMAEYPITDIIYEHPDPATVNIYKTIFEDYVEIKKLLVEIGIDYNLYGNVFLSILPPFVRTFIGKRTGKEYTPTKHNGTPNWMTRDGKLFFRDKNGSEEEVDIVDLPAHRYEFKILRWDPMSVELDYNELSGNTEYYYVLSKKVKNQLHTNPDWLKDTPKVFIEAWLKGADKVKFNKTQFIAIQRPSALFSEYKGWGMPLPIAALPAAFHKQMLRRTQNAILKDRMLPYRYVSPPVELITENSPLALNLEEWAEKVKQQLTQWRINPNNFGIMPVPVITGSLSGEGRQLLVFQEMQLLDDQVIIAMGVPIEFVRGGLQWSGTSVSLRMLENHFLNYRNSLKKLFAKLVQIISTTLDIPTITVRLKDFKMADDIMVKQAFMQLASSGMISKETLLAQFELDYNQEQEKIMNEMKDQIEMQKQQMIEQAKVQAESQKIMQYENPEFQMVPENMSTAPLTNAIGQMQITGPFNPAFGMMPPTQQPMPQGPETEPLPEQLPPRRDVSPM